MKIISLALFLIFLISCNSYHKTKDGYTIKGQTKIVFNSIDKSLNSKSIVSGFVYSRDTKEFIEDANVKIGENQFITDKNGFFKALITPGIYTVSTKFVGNKEEVLKKLIVKENHRLIIIFELGTAVIY